MHVHVHIREEYQAYLLLENQETFNTCAEAD